MVRGDVLTRRQLLLAAAAGAGAALCRVAPNLVTLVNTVPPYWKPFQAL